MVSFVFKVSLLIHSVKSDFVVNTNINPFFNNLFLICRNNDGRGAPGTPNFATRGCDQRPSIPSQAGDPIVDAWSRALEGKTKKEIPPNINSSNEVQTTS